MQNALMDQRIPRRPGDRYVLKDAYTLLMRIALLRADAPRAAADSYDDLEARVRSLVVETEAAAR